MWTILLDAGSDNTIFSSFSFPFYYRFMLLDVT